MCDWAWSLLGVPTLKHHGYRLQKCLMGRMGICWLKWRYQCAFTLLKGCTLVAQAELNDFWAGLGLWLNVLSYHSSLSDIFCFIFLGNHIFGMVTSESIMDSVDSAVGLKVSQ